MNFPKRLFSLFFISLVFLAGFGQTNTRKGKAKNVILMVGDGMGIAHTYAAYTANGGYLNMFRFPILGMSITYSADNYVTDSAAGATAFSCGEKTKNGMLAVDSTGKYLVTILEIAKKNKLSTGLVVTCNITHATPAAFIAHVDQRAKQDSIALFFLSGNADIFIGGGIKNFQKRADNRNLFKELAQKGYQAYSTLDDIKKGNAQKFHCLMADDGLPTTIAGRGDVLPNATAIALDRLSENENGFFLMVEGSQIDWGGHNNDFPYIVKETQDFDKAVGVALNFAMKDTNTLVIVTSDHETGGLALTGGNLNTKEMKSGFSAKYHTAIPVMVYSYGPGAESFAGCYQNTAIFYKMMDAYGFKK